MKRLVLILFTSLCLSACATHHGTFTVISNQIVDLDNIDLSTSKKIRNVKGETVTHIVSFIPIGDLNPTVEAAMDDAFERVDGDLFTNASIRESFFYIPYIYGKGTLSIEGDVIKTRN